MEKESLRKMSEIEGELYSWFTVITPENSNWDVRVNKLKKIQNRVYDKRQTTNDKYEI